MGLRSAEAGARVAIVGAEMPAGVKLREALAAHGCPGSRVDLFGTSRGEALLGDYAGEARLIQEIDPAEICERDVVFLCDYGAFAGRFGRAVERGGVVVDLVGALPPEIVPRLVHVGINPAGAREHAGYLRVPHELTLLLSEILAPLELRFGIEDATAVVLRPAADFGDRGVEELREQVVGLLRFDAVRSEVLGGQLAFNVLPYASAGDAPRRIEALVSTELVKLFGWDRPRLALRTVVVPVFHGHGVQLRLRLRAPATPDEVAESLAAAGLLGAAAKSQAVEKTPLEIAGERRTVVAEIVEDGLAGFWIWAVAGEVQARGAELAVRTAVAAAQL